MKTNVEFIGKDDYPDSQLFQKDKPRWEVGDKGVIDGYVCDQHGDTFACVILGSGRIVTCKLHKLKVTSHEK